MSIVCTEYNRESFFDEYSPLCDVRTRPKPGKFGDIRRRCFPEILLTNNPLSRFWRNTSKEERSYLLDEAKEDMRRDSGYSSIAPEGEWTLFIPSIDERKSDNLEPFFSDEEDQPVNKSVASFVKRRTKLMYTRNLKLCKNKSKTKNNVIDAEDKPRTQITTEQNQSNNCTQGHRSRTLSWKNAKKQVAIVVRFIRRESKPDDEISLLADKFTEENNSVTNTEIDGLVTCNDEGSNNNFDAYHEKASVTSTDKKNINLSPLSMKYFQPKNHRISRPRLQQRPKSLMPNLTPNLTHKNNTDTGSSDFVQKYLIRSKSLEDVFESTALSERETNDFEQSELREYFKEGDSLRTRSNSLFDKVSVDSEIDVEGDNFENSENAEERFQMPEKLLPQQSNDNRDKKLNGGIFVNVNHASSLSYSVNDLYDLFNQEGIFSFDNSYEGLVV